jgi:hypothetical protein
VLKRLWIWFVAVALTLGPAGFSESIENLAHLAASGHVAHAEAASDEQDSHRDLEHGCVAAFHTCVCCSHQPMFFTQIDVLPAPPAASLESFEACSVTNGPSGERARIFRPPVG